VLASALIQDAAARIGGRCFDLASPPSGTVRAFEGGLIAATGLDAPVGTLCRVMHPCGQTLEAEVVGFRGQRLLLMPFAEPADLRPGARLFAHKEGSFAKVGTGLLGRVIDGAGLPADGLGPVVAPMRAPLSGRPAAPLERGVVRTAVATGVRAIDAVATLGRGQRIGLVAGSGVGKSVLLGMIARFAQADVVVVALVGERGREVSDFLENKLPADKRERAVVVAAPADQAAVLRVRSALRAMAIAEHFREEGVHVLLLLDSLTRVAHAQREVGLALGEPAAARGYPPSALALIARLVERAGVSVRSGGAITMIATVLADGDDAQDPVVDAARAILDGHIVLDRALAERGHYPAIHAARSLSRCMSDIVPEAHEAAARRLRRHFALYEANRDLLAMGAWKAGQDAELDAAIAAQPAVMAFLAQRPDAPAPLDQTVGRLVAEFGR